MSDLLIKTDNDGNPFILRRVEDYYPVQCIFPEPYFNMGRPDPLDLILTTNEMVYLRESRYGHYHSQKELFKGFLKMGKYSNYSGTAAYTVLNISPGCVRCQESNIIAVTMVHREDIPYVRSLVYNGEEVPGAYLQMWMIPEHSVTNKITLRFLKRLKKECVIEEIPYYQSGDLISKVSTRVERIYTTPKSFYDHLFEIKKSMLSLYKGYRALSNQSGDIYYRSLGGGSFTDNITSRVIKKSEIIGENGLVYVETLHEIQRRRTFVMGIRRT